MSQKKKKNCFPLRLNTGKPLAITGLSLIRKGSTFFHLNWTRSTADHYRPSVLKVSVYRADTNDVEREDHVPISAAHSGSFNVTDLAPGTAYIFSVVASNQYGDSLRFNTKPLQTIGISIKLDITK